MGTFYFNKIPLVLAISELLKWSNLIFIQRFIRDQKYFDKWRFVKKKALKVYTIYKVRYKQIYKSHYIN